MPHTSQVIITGDDLGYSAVNNAGIVKAHREGILTSASLMVGGDAIGEAIDLIRQYPSLTVGLHVTFNDTRPVLPPERLGVLVQTDGYFPAQMSTLRSAAYTVKGRRQIRAEIAAQFDVFQTIGIVCDHVDTHRHSLLHPIIALLVFQEAARRRVSLTRIPWDPPSDPARYFRAKVLRQLAASYGLRSPDRSIGRQWSVNSLVDCLTSVPTGMTEFYFHPVDTSDHMFAADLPVLLDHRVKTSFNSIRK